MWTDTRGEKCYVGYLKPFFKVWSYLEIVEKGKVEQFHKTQITGHWTENAARLYSILVLGLLGNGIKTDRTQTTLRKALLSFI